MAGSHSRLSPSGAHRYLHCHAAPSAEEGLPNWESFYAFEGTCLHEIAERCLLDGGDPHRFIGEEFKSDPKENEKNETFIVTIDKDHADCMVSDLELVRSILGGPEAEMHVETRGDLTWPLGAGEAGTSDIGGRDQNGDIHIMDWKFGAGIVVEAWENDQLRLYALGTIFKHWPELLTEVSPDRWIPVKSEMNRPVHIHILQPRAAGGGDHCEITLDDLMLWANEVYHVVHHKIYGPNPTYSPGPKTCQWCAARKGDPLNGIAPCKAYMALNLEIAQAIHPDLDENVDMGIPATPTSAHGMSITKAIWVSDNAPMFKKWLDELHERLYTDLSVGRPVPGKKLVEGRRNARAFSILNEESLASVLSHFPEENTVNVKRKSPAQLEKSLGGDVYDLVIDPFVTQPPGKPVIVDESNPKPAIPSAASLHQDLDDKKK